MNEIIISDVISTEKINSVICDFCKGKGTNISVDAINPDGTVVNPRKAACMVCDGFGSYIPEKDDE